MNGYPKESVEDDHLFTKAQELKKRGDLMQSLQILESLRARHGHSAALLAAIGDAQWQMRDLPAATLSFREAIDSAPAWLPPSLGLFHCLWEQGKHRDALEEAKRFTATTGSDEYMEIVREINDKW